MPPNLDHLLVQGFSEPSDFKSTLSVQKQPPPQLDRQGHGEKLLGQISKLADEEDALRQKRIELELPPKVGTTIAIEISPAGAVDYFKQLEWKLDGIEILSSTVVGGTEIVSVHVPDGKLSAFEKRITKYLNENVKPKKGKEDKPTGPKHANLVNAIASFRKAAFAELWTDEAELPPDDQAQSWYQVWLRLGVTTTPQQVRDAFAQAAQKFSIQVEPGYVTFPGRTVVAVLGSRAQLQQALELLDAVAEIRATKPTAKFFLSDLKPFEQAEWMNDLQARLSHAGPEAPYIALLDTGVNNGHPLLQPILSDEDRHAADEAWGGHDDDGHGTQMAGLLAYGNLTEILWKDEGVEIRHRLESVRIWPPEGQNPSHIYGALTGAAVSRVEQQPRSRTFAMMTTAEGRTWGWPSEWSAAVDRLAFGLSVDVSEAAETDRVPRLFVISAGNIPWPEWGASNDEFQIEDPAQAWNALVIGACTELDEIGPDTPELTPIAAAGSLAPSSRTSREWKSAWPFKPDVVAEGGNGSMHAQRGPSAGPAELRLISTSHDPIAHPYAETGDTSAAAAEAARICASVSARYPDYWPETVRALVVQGARITPQMRSEMPLKLLKADKECLLRRVGYGKVNLDESVNSTLKRPTLILQESLVPYIKEGGKTRLGKMNLHELPWPANQLEQLGGANVSLRITLSYFVAPNPSRRGWQSKFRYQSHGLRFAVKGATESDAEFLQRINKVEREREEVEAGIKAESTSDPDADEWVWGAQLRSRGSIHSDTWRGSAAKLAQKSHIAVFPVGGWWKDWAESGHHSKPVRYSLVVSLEAPEEVDVDIYTPIANLIGIPVTT